MPSMVPVSALPQAEAPAGGAPLLEAEQLAKSFGATRALLDATLTILPGEVHALIGENGSGKSTLVKLVSGVHRPDSGTLRVAGSSVRHPRSPAEALRRGIATVYQEVLTVGSRSVAQNMALGRDGLFRRAVSSHERASSDALVLSRLLGRDVPLDMPADALSLSDRQAVCIARGLARDPKVLILDEATSALDVATRDRLFALLTEHAGRGAAVIFISHRMDEIQTIANRVTVMRSGKTIATLAAKDAAPEELVRLMSAVERESTARQAARPARREEVLLSVSGITLREGATPAALELRAGELVGLAGLEGHGQATFLQLIGAGGGHGSKVEVDGRQVRSPHEAAAAGLVYVPRERRTEGVFASKSIRENFALPTMDRDARGGLLRASSAERRFAGFAERLGIQYGHHDDRITTLSGGNQQKVVIARWLAADPRVLLLNDPTRGIDHGAKQDLYRLLRSLCDEGVAVVMLSTEVEELIELMDRVLVFRDQQLEVELAHEELTPTRLVGAFFGTEGT